MKATRYDPMFARLAEAGEGALIPFFVVGDPDPGLSTRLIDAAIAAGADALELGLPFSDPVADGPVIQAAGTRALEAGATVAAGWSQIRSIRARHPQLPIGLLCYANLAVARGVDRFYREAAAAGVDSILLADVPADEIEPFRAAADSAGVAPVLVVPPNADRPRIARILALTRGYCYVTSRAGVTGGDDGIRRDLAARLADLAIPGAPPAVVGFGIATPEQAAAALRAGARGVIVGSALVRLVDAHRLEPDLMVAAVGTAVGRLKAATRSRGRAAVRLPTEPGEGAVPSVGIASDAGRTEL